MSAPYNGEPLPTEAFSHAERVLNTDIACGGRNLKAKTVAKAGAARRREQEGPSGHVAFEITMTDAALYKLAKRAGIAVQWRDFAGGRHQVTVETLRRVLDAMDLPCATPNDLEESLRSFESQAMPALLTATIGRTVHLPVEARPQHVRIQFESGDFADVQVESEGHGVSLPPFREIGYHQIEIGDERISIAAAPARCKTVSDIAPGERIWGLAAQVYGLRSAGDCGLGDMAGVAALGQAAANMGADVLALSPLHALFAADPSHFQPVFAIEPYVL